MEQADTAINPDAGGMLTDEADGFQDILEDMQNDVAFAHALCDIVGSRYVFLIVCPIPLAEFLVAGGLTIIIRLGDSEQTEQGKTVTGHIHITCYGNDDFGLHNHFRC